MLKYLGGIQRSPCLVPTFMRFASVGAMISVIDIGLLYLGLSFGFDRYVTRMGSLAAAVAVGYVLNRYFTFHHVSTGRALAHSLLRHYAVYACGSALNIGVYALVLEVGQLLGGRVTASSPLPLLGVWIGGVVGLCFNFFFSKKVVFDN